MLASSSRSLIFSFSLLTIVTQLGFAFELPFWGSCTVKDEKCHRKYTEKFFEMYGKGIPELNVATMDPMNLGNITINGNSNENFNLKLTMYDVKLHNYPDVKCLGVKGFTKDTSKPTKVVIKILSPHLIMRTHCKVNGKLLIFNVEGDTDLKIDINNLTTVMTGVCVPYTKDDKVYIKVTELKPKIKIESLKVQFSNSTLFNGEEVFMNTFADTINDNWQVLSDEISPHLEESNSRISIDILNKSLATKSYDHFFKEE